MTKQEKIIVSAYTGVLMCDFHDLHEYIQKKFGRPVFTHELADKGIQKEVEEKSKEEFLEICNREEPERKKWEWFEFESDEDKYDIIKCPCCKHTFTVDSYHYTDIGFVKDDFNFCPNCGADMRGEENGKNG